MDDLFKFCDDGKVRYRGVNDKETIMTIWINGGNVCVFNNTDCDDIDIPISVICKLISLNDKTKIRSELNDYLK